MIASIRKSPWARALAAYLALHLVFSDVLLTRVTASSGPNQTENMGSPSQVLQDMVDPATGDFSYSIPLLEVDGFPLALNYAAGIRMDQDASWVGLGWSLNPGVIQRTLRGLPDDFNGDEVVEEISRKPHHIVSGKFRFAPEFFGIGGGPTDAAGQLMPSNRSPLIPWVGLFYDNYYGFGWSADWSPGFFAIDFNSHHGMGFSGNASIPLFNNSLSLTGSTTYNSQQGIRDINIGVTVNPLQIASGYVSNPTISSALSDYEFPITGSARIPIGTRTVIPPINYPTINTNFSYSAALGGEAEGFYGAVGVAGGHSMEILRSNTVTRKAFGYMNLHNAKWHSKPMMDFNLEGRHELTESTPNLPVVMNTYDLFSANAPGLQIQFRAHRNDFGSYHHTDEASFSSSFNPGAEVGAGALIAEVGVDLNMLNGVVSSGKWPIGGSGDLLQFRSLDPTDPAYEPVVLRASGENLPQRSSLYASLGGKAPVAMELSKAEGFFDKVTLNDRLVDNNLNTVYSFGSSEESTYNQERVPRTTVINYLSAKEAEKVGNQKIIRNHALNDFNLTVHNTASGDHFIGDMSYAYSSRNRKSHANGQDHHMSEVQVVTGEGSRYNYGVPTYSREYYEVSFNISKEENGEPIFHDGSVYEDGLVPYLPGFNDSKDNNRGVDHFYSKKSTNNYPTSFLLTEVLSPDFVDLTGNGPSIDDHGEYTKINYTRTDASYGWRFPFAANLASFSPGFRSYKRDDMGSYTYGSKEQWYMHSIETKNHLVEFTISEREDGYGATQQGTINPADRSYRLDRIEVYSRWDKAKNESAAPLKVIRFEYDYSLCQGTPDNIGGGGKLTLRRVMMEDGTNTRGGESPYVFHYADPNHDQPVGPTPGEGNGNLFNMDYDFMSNDTWGNYKEKVAGANEGAGSPVSNADFPYPNNNYRNDSPFTYDPDRYAAMWSLSSIQLPKGGDIRVDYESDDYGYIQDERTMQLFQVEGFRYYDSGIGAVVTGNELYEADDDLFGVSESHFDMVVQLTKPLTTSTEEDAIWDFKTQYLPPFQSLEDNRPIYFKFAVNVGNEANEYDFVTGYFEVEEVVGMLPVTSGGGFDRAIIRMRPVHQNDKETSELVNPISKATWQMVRNHLRKVALPGQEILANSSSVSLETIKELLLTFTTEVNSMTQGINQVLQRKNIGRLMVPQRSFVRLYNPDYKKKGGGHRVKRILVSDGWSEMNDPNANPDHMEASIVHGYEYRYTQNPTGTALPESEKPSSGVASYEPLVGGEEIALRFPVDYIKENKLYVDDIFSLEKPYGEALFPNPQVIYSKVLVSPIVPDHDVTYNSLQPTLYEHYTTREFPLDVQVTEIQQTEKKPNPIRSFANLNSVYELGMSQGYSFVFNDMHGKLKKVSGNGVSKEYFYKVAHIQAKQPKVDNMAEVIDETGSKEELLLNTDFDIVNYSHLAESERASFTSNSNTNVVYAVVPLPVPTGFATVARDVERYMYSTTTKVIQEYGTLEKIVVNRGGVVSEEQNYQYEASTGKEVYKNQNNPFALNEPYGSFNYPAWWVYPQMGPAHQNIDKRFSETANNEFVEQIGRIKSIVADHFTEGDEVMVWSESGAYINDRLWVIIGKITIENVEFEGKYLIDRDGVPFVHTSPLNFKIIRSGYRNQLNDEAAGFTARVWEPGTTWNDPASTSVLEAFAQEFSEEHRVFPSCQAGTANPFIYNAKGAWRPTESWLPDQSRTYTYTVALRDDGYFPFTPYWNLAGGEWTEISDKAKWELKGQNQLYSPYGNLLEITPNQKVTNSAGHHQNHAASGWAVGNGKYKEAAAETFEDMPLLEGAFTHDYASYDCAQDHFGFHSLIADNSAEEYLTDAHAHTGRFALQLPPLSSPTSATELGWENNFMPDVSYSIGDELPLSYNDFTALPQFGFDNTMVSGETFSFTYSYWRKVGEQPEFTWGANGNGGYNQAYIDCTVKSSGTPLQVVAENTEASEVIDGWQKVTRNQTILFQGESGLRLAVELHNSHASKTAFFDDFRIHPADAEMVVPVFDLYSNRKVAELDNRNNAVFFLYDESGRLIGVNNENADGIKTAKEIRTYTKKN